MSSDPNNTLMEKEAQNESQEHDPDTEELLDTILSDPRKIVALLLRIGLDGQQKTEGEKADTVGSLQVVGCTCWDFFGLTRSCRCCFQATWGIWS